MSVLRWSKRGRRIWQRVRQRDTCANHVLVNKKLFYIVPVHALDLQATDLYCQRSASPAPIIIARAGNDLKGADLKPTIFKKLLNTFSGEKA